MKNTMCNGVLPEFSTVRCGSEQGRERVHRATLNGYNIIIILL